MKKKSKKPSKKATVKLLKAAGTKALKAAGIPGTYIKTHVVFM